MKKQAITVEHLDYTYTGQDGLTDRAVFEDLNVRIEKGSFVAVLGHNGCGKSTLAKHFNAILLPQGGSVTICGMDTADEEQLLEIRRCVGMVFQNPDNQIVSNVVEEDVAFAPENLSVPSAQIRERVDEALQQVGMSEYRKHAPHLLSGGQKQRIAIAGVIAMRPACIVFDEPTAMLDPQGRREVLDTIRKLNRENAITIVLITHHMREAALADRVIAMHKGKIILDGTPKEVFSHVDELRKIGLDVPETTQLMYALNQEGLTLPLEALSVDECADALLQVFETPISSGGN
ncbi:MAG: energy-coupling factor transporter ATPase [Oscillospiraceae bacterium]|nr:energy-coupling factor transporter ATPase [Oscillospiraceae bacterium]